MKIRLFVVSSNYVATKFYVALIFPIRSYSHVRKEPSFYTQFAQNESYKKIEIDSAPMSYVIHETGYGLMIS